MQNDFMSTGFHWFLGVVEDVKDPEQINRVRVRCFGYHTDDKAKVLTEALPWATVMLPTTSAGISGIGTSPHGLINGSWVCGFFRDGSNAQDPIVMGSISSTYMEKPNAGVGFVDPDGAYPKLQGGDELVLENPGAAPTEETFIDVNINARGTNNIVDKVDDTFGQGPSAGPSYPYDNKLPASDYASVYPDNKVTQTISGHIIEVDDTAGVERLKIYHRSGTFVEMHPNGDVVQNNNNKWQITTGNDSAHITGNVEIHIDKEATVVCPDTYWKGNIHLDGDINITGTSTADVDHISGPNTISGHNHTHTDHIGQSANQTTRPSNKDPTPVPDSQ